MTWPERYLLNGPVKEVMQTTFKAHTRNGEVFQGKILEGSNIHVGNSIFRFSREGEKLSEMEVIGINSYFIDTFNEKGLYLEHRYYYSDNLQSRIVHIYNEAGLNVGSVSYNGAGQILSRNSIHYDENGLKTEEFTFKGESDKWSTKTVNSYVGPLLTVADKPYRKPGFIIRYLPDGTIEHESSWVYNTDWKEIERISRHSDPKLQEFDRRVVSKYNTQGDIIRQEVFKLDGTFETSYSFHHEYDEVGNKIVAQKEENANILDLNPLGEGEWEQLEEDHHGNWVKRTVFFKEIPRYISTRQISYYGEDSENNSPFEHPLLTSKPDEVMKVKQKLEKLADEQVRWVMEGANANNAFPLHRYYAMKFQDLPSTFDFNYEHVEVMALLKILKNEMAVNLVNSTFSRTNYCGFTSYVLAFQFHPGYLLSVTGITQVEAENYKVPSNLNEYIEDLELLSFGKVELLRPSEDSELFDEVLEQDLKYFIESCEVSRQPQKPFIHILEVSGSNYFLKAHPVSDKFEIRDLDINYGSGFTNFHNGLMSRFNSSTKGLVLFHGEPGTGKTFYIRHLLRKMVAHRKKVIYMPPNMVDHLIDPAFMSFLSREIRNWSIQGQFCVLLIEDAEPLLARRREGIRIQGVTNLLNLSDGLLNDLLNLQIICTFNVDLKKLDSALLRPGRLIARKEFKRLDELDANLLAQRLGIQHHFTEPATLSEVYGMMENQTTLIHDVSNPGQSAGSELDDL